MMKEALMKALGKPPKQKEGDDLKKEAKMGVLKDLKDAATQAMGNGLMSGMQKVTVAAKDKEGLKQGLEKAEEIIEGESGESDYESEDSEEEAPEVSEKRLCDLEDPEEIKAALKMLMEKKKGMDV